ncbi:50S ribosomal protein L1 [Candidatus Woesearchaeota archaeon]|nr:50S ribosomal protein L1 [Candidatus Woesearchaeota archaeon]
MDKNTVLEALKKAREAKKRKFEQKFDLIMNFRDLDLKKPDHQVDFYTSLPKDTGRSAKICAFVTPDLVEKAKADCDGVVSEDDFQKYAADKKLTRKLAKQYDYFIAQATIMAKVATSFGRVLGPKGKMPNPKAGAVFPPNAPLKPIVARLRKTIRISAKLAPIVQCMVGKESMSDDDVADNLMALYEQVVHHLPNELANVRSAYVKLTMGSAVKLK